MAKPKPYVFFFTTGIDACAHRAILLMVFWPGPMENLLHLSFNGDIGANSQCLCSSTDSCRTSSRKKRAVSPTLSAFQTSGIPGNMFGRCSPIITPSTSTTMVKPLKVFSSCYLVGKDSRRLFNPHQFCDSDLDSASWVLRAVCLLISPGMSTSVMHPPPPPPPRTKSIT